MERLLIDLARGGRVLQASDEYLNPAERLLDPADPIADPDRRGSHGAWLDGWETRRIRPPGHEWAIVRLGRPGTIHRVVVDTSHVTLSLPIAWSVEAVDLPGDPGLVDLLRNRSRWREIVQRSEVRGSGRHGVDVEAVAATHLRLVIYPDGGVARLRVYGDPRPPADLAGRGAVDLASLDLGARVVSASDAAASPPNRMLEPGGPADHRDGWITRRRRRPGNEWAIIRLAGPGTLDRVEVDTRRFPGDAPERVAVMAIEAAATPRPDDPGWRTLVEPSEVRPDAVERFEIEDDTPATHLRLDLLPDGAVARFRAIGSVAATDDEAGDLAGG
jgi:allantoicase